MSEEKLLNAMLYFIEKVDNGTLGKVKLAKLLFFADALHYLNKGRGFLGVRFQKFPRGPVPRQFSKLLDQWDGKYFQMQEGEYFGYEQTRFILSSDYHSNLEIFEKAELAALDSAITQFKDDTASDVSDFSHQMLPWESLPLYGDIPLKLVAYSQSQPFQEDNGVSLTDPSVTQQLENAINAD